MIASMPDTVSGDMAALGMTFISDPNSQFLRNLGVFSVGLDAIRTGVKPFIGFSIGGNKAVNGIASLLQYIGIDDVNANSLPTSRGRITAARHDPDRSFVKLLKSERRRRPADINLARHSLGQGNGRSSGRNRTRLDIEMF